jgi:hypothetical protein
VPLPAPPLLLLLLAWGVPWLTRTPALPPLPLPPAPPLPPQLLLGGAAPLRCRAWLSRSCCASQGVTSRGSAARSPPLLLLPASLRALPGESSLLRAAAPAAPRKRWTGLLPHACIGRCTAAACGGDSGTGDPTVSQPLSCSLPLSLLMPLPLLPLLPSTNPKRASHSGDGATRDQCVGAARALSRSY